MLKRMARDTAPDVQLNDLIPLQLSHGKMTVGDRDLLEAGLKAEGEGDYDTAIMMYKRAGLHTNSHIYHKCSLRKYTMPLENLCRPWSIWTMLLVP